MEYGLKTSVYQASTTDVSPIFYSILKYISKLCLQESDLRYTFIV
jgi:hypothetical protein